jgi:two-component sensor histidine kinase
MDVEQVIPLGLIINELISNALKYAFDNQKSGEIKLIIQQKVNELFVQVKDNGVGLPVHFNLDENNSLGFKLIQIFSKKLKANLDIQSEDGTSISMHIPLSA